MPNFTCFRSLIFVGPATFDFSLSVNFEFSFVPAFRVRSSYANMPPYIGLSSLWLGASYLQLHAHKFTDHATCSNRPNSENTHSCSCSNDCCKILLVSLRIRNVIQAAFAALKGIELSDENWIEHCFLLSFNSRNDQISVSFKRTRTWNQLVSPETRRQKEEKNHESLKCGASTPTDKYISDVALPLRHCAPLNHWMRWIQVKRKIQSLEKVKSNIPAWSVRHYYGYYWVHAVRRGHNLKSNYDCHLSGTARIQNLKFWQRIYAICARKLRWNIERSKMQLYNIPSTCTCRRKRAGVCSWPPGCPFFAFNDAFHLCLEWRNTHTQRLLSLQFFVLNIFKKYNKYLTSTLFLAEAEADAKQTTNAH